MMTMKEACAYVKNQKAVNAIHRNKIIAIDGACSGVTEKQYKSIKTKVKGASSHGRKYSHTKLWSYYDEAR